MTDRAKRADVSEWPAVERRKPGWARDWQSSVEQDKANLAQSLHDNTGGLLVAAVMDITWAEGHIHGAAEVKARLVRARAALDVAIGLNRRMIEDLRPTLLDNFGLVTALKWHLSEVCKSADIACEQHLPEQGVHFSPAAAIALYRIAQTLIAVMISHSARGILLRLGADAKFVTLLMSCNGMPTVVVSQDEMFTDALASITGRVKALSGDVRFDAPPGGASITCRLPADTALASAIEQPVR